MNRKEGEMVKVSHFARFTTLIATPTPTNPRVLVVSELSAPSIVLGTPTMPSCALRRFWYFLGPEKEVLLVPGLYKEVKSFRVQRFNHVRNPSVQGQLSMSDSTYWEVQVCHHGSACLVAYDVILQSCWM